MKLVTVFSISFLLSSLGLFAQNANFKAEISSTLIASSESEIPFWLRANSGFQFSEFTNFSGVVDGVYTYNFNTFNIEAGAYVFARDGVENNIQRRDLYLEVKNRWLKVTLGSKQRDEAFFGLSSTNQNYLLSNNARPLPGLIIEANEPLHISKKIKIDWGIAHYLLNDDRFVDDTRVHYKRLNVFAALSRNSTLTLGIQHFAQWAGTSPNFGDLKDDLNAFWNVFIANRSTELGVDGEIENAVGNHLGTYLLRYDLKTKKGDFSFYHEHPFEDGSGTRLQNFPDGVWGLTYKPPNSTFFKGILYEYVDTRSQSGTASGSGRDNYFSNLVYRSGWTYEQNIIGMPFFKVDKSLDVNSGITTVTGSRFQVHHLGFSGSFKQINWQIKSSIAQSFGTFYNPFTQELNTWHNYLNIEYKTQVYGTFQFIGGWDTGDLENDIIAVGLGYKYGF